MLCFTLFHCRFEICFSFFALTSLLILLDDTTYIVICLAACLIHETAHLCAMIILDIRVHMLSLSCRGVTIIPAVRTLPVMQELMLCASGCTVNLLCSLLYFVNTSDVRIKLFAVMSLAVGILNLLPVSGMDGARILSIMLKGRKTKAQPYINITAAALVCIVAAKLIYSRANITVLLFVAAVLLSAAESISFRKHPRV